MYLQIDVDIGISVDTDVVYTILMLVFSPNVSCFSVFIFFVFNDCIFFISSRSFCLIKSLRSDL